jgi:hypothetical protein
MSPPLSSAPDVLPPPPADLDLASARVLDVDPTGRSESGRRYALRYGESRIVQLSESAWWLLTIARDRVPLPQAAAEWASREETAASITDLRRHYNRILSQLAAIAPPASPRRGPLFRQRVLIPARAARAAASRLHLLFTWPAVAVVMALSVSGYGLAWHRGLRMADHYGLALSYGLFLLAKVVHELGHAAALSAYGGRCGDVLIGTGWTGPGLFTEVTDVWRLPRAKRIAVNIGGVYLQAAATAGYAAAYSLTGWSELATAMVLSTITMATSLVPVGASDGSWIVAELMNPDNPRVPITSVHGRSPARPFARLVHALLAATPWLAVAAALGVYLLAAGSRSIAAFPNDLRRLISGNGSNVALVVRVTVAVMVPGTLLSLLRPFIHNTVRARHRTCRAARLFRPVRCMPNVSDGSGAHQVRTTVHYGHEERSEQEEPSGQSLDHGCPARDSDPEPAD